MVKKSKPGFFFLFLVMSYITAISRSASHTDIYVEVDNESRLTATPFDKRDDFNFSIVSFPFI